MSKSRGYYCCHACSTVFHEKHGIANLHCNKCGKDFPDAEYPELQDMQSCPTPDCDGTLDGGIACPECGAGGDELGPADDTCMCGHRPEHAPDCYKARAPRSKE